MSTVTPNSDIAKTDPWYGMNIRKVEFYVKLVIICTHQVSSWPDQGTGMNLK